MVIMDVVVMMMMVGHGDGVGNDNDDDNDNSRCNKISSNDNRYGNTRDGRKHTIIIIIVLYYFTQLPRPLNIKFLKSNQSG